MRYLFNEDHMHDHMQDSQVSKFYNNEVVKDVVIEQHGTLAGHIIPGSMFILWATWWLLAYTYKIIKNQKAVGHFHENDKPWFKFKYFTVVEPVTKILLSFIGVMIELWWGQDKFRFLIGPDGYFEWRAVQTYQHGLMFFAILLSGVVDLIGSFRTLPYGAEYAFLALAFFGESSIIALHLMGSGLDTTLHYVLCLTGYACAIFTVLEPVFKHSVMITYGRILAVFLQGSWFIQIGDILYSGKRPWNPTHPAGMMYLPVVLVMHILFISLFILGVYVTFDVILNGFMKPKQTKYEKVANMDEEQLVTQIEKNNSNKQTQFIKTQ